MRCDRCKQLGHNTRGCRGTTHNAKEEAQKEGTSGETNRGTINAKTKEGDLGPGIDWGYDTDAEEKKKKKVKRTTRKQGGDTINLLAQRPITLVLVMINSCSYSTNDLVHI